VANGLVRLPGAPGEPRFAKDEFGRTIMFVPSPRPGEGFIRVETARQLGLAPTKPFWRFNRLQGQFEKIKSRRMNPFNFKATKRAGRRVERTLDAVKELVRIERKMTTGKVNILAGKFSEFLQEDSKVSVAITSELASLFASVIIGNELLMDGQEVSPTNAGPRNPEDVLVQGFGQKSDRVIVKLRNGNALTNITRSSIFIEPV